MAAVPPPELEQFLILEARLTDNTLGTGAYGAVEEATIPGATIAAKKLHSELVNLGSPEQVHKWSSDFIDECKLMSQLRHPHVVQFLGVCYIPGSQIPVLLMEKLQTSLDSLLETTPNIPLDVKVYLLTGTGRGVVYLHSRNPPVIHRDLTARNILIDSGLTAKIADLGVARMVNIQPGQRAATMTQGPGNGLYMPPEATPGEEATRYNTSIDIFSFGVVGLFTLTQTFPKNVKQATYFDPVTRKIIGRSEIERRQEYIDPMKASLGEDHPLVKMTLDCLEYLPEDRPSAEEVLTRLEEVGSTIPQQCTETKLELIKRITRHGEEMAQVRAEALEELKRELSGKENQVTEQQVVIDQLQVSSNNLQVANSDLQNAIEHLEKANHVIQTTNSDLQAAFNLLQTEKEEQVKELQKLTTAQQRQLEIQKKEIEQLSDQLRLASETYQKQQDKKISELQAAKDRLQAEKQEQVAGLQELTTLQQQQLEVQRREIEQLSDQLKARVEHKGADKPVSKPKKPSKSNDPIFSIVFEWRRLEDIPRHLSVYGQPVVLNEKLYIKGDNGQEMTVLQYSPDQDRWDQLPPPNVDQFTLSTLKGSLAAVGGRFKTTGSTADTILTFNAHSRQWVPFYPTVTIALSSPTVVEYKNNLIVAGGHNSKASRVYDVNILDTSTNEWLTAKRLPSTDTYRTVLIEDTVYLFGEDSKRVLCAHVPTLVSQDLPVTWESLPYTKYSCSSPVAISNTLVTLGGSDKTTSIHMYNTSKRIWTEVGEVPFPMYDSHCVILSTELFVLGGHCVDYVYAAKWLTY